MVTSVPKNGSRAGARTTDGPDDDPGGRVRGDHHFAMTPEYVLYADISANAVRLFGVLNRHAQKDDGLAHIRRRSLAGECRISGSAYDRALAELRTLGAVTTAPTRTSAGDQGANDFYIHMSPPRGWEATPKPGPIARSPRRRKAADDTDSGEGSHQERGDRSHQERGDLSPSVVSHIREPSSESPWVNERSTPVPAAPSPGVRAEASAAIDLQALEVLEGEIVGEEKTETAQTIIRAWIDWRKSTPNKAVLGQTAKLVKQLLEQGVASADIRYGLALLTQRELHPSTLPSLVDNVIASRTATQREAVPDHRSGPRSRPEAEQQYYDRLFSQAYARAAARDAAAEEGRSVDVFLEPGAGGF